MLFLGGLIGLGINYSNKADIINKQESIIKDLLDWLKIAHNIGNETEINLIEKNKL